MITCEQKTVSVQCFHKFKYCTVGFSVGYSRHIILQHNYTLSMYILKCHFFHILFLVIWHYLVNSFCAFWKQSLFILLTKWHLHSQTRKQDLLRCQKKKEEKEEDERRKTETKTLLDMKTKLAPLSKKKKKEKEKRKKEEDERRKTETKTLLDMKTA